MIKIKQSLYIVSSIVVAFVVSFWMFYKRLIAGYPGFFIGNTDAIHGLKNVTGLWSHINFGEPSIQNSWLALLSQIYNLIRYLGINPFLFNSMLCFACLLSSYLYIKKIANIQYQKSDIFVFLVATAFSFSTFSLIYFEQGTFFVYLYWLVPLKLYVICKIKENKLYRFSNVLLIILFSSINLPFGIFVEFISFTYLFLSKKMYVKEFLYYAFLSVASILISILPSLVYTLANISYSSGVLASETFYRINTSAISFIRGITHWGFYDQYNGYLYRGYSTLFKTLFGQLTGFLFTVPLLIIIINKDYRTKNIIIVSLLILIASLTIGDKYIVTDVFLSVFNYIPMSEIFRDNSKFFFVINSLILLLVTFNKNIKVSSVVWFVSCAPVIYLFLSGIILQPNTTNHNPSKDYSIIYENNLVSKEDSVVLFPAQYMPVYKGEGDKEIKSIVGYSRPEFFFESNVVLRRCIGCGNPILREDVEILTDVGHPNWSDKIKEYGISKLIYDTNVNTAYYDGTLSVREFENKLDTKNVGYFRVKQGSIFIYSLDINKKDNLTACDPLWIRYKNSSLIRECQKGQKHFSRSSGSIFVPDIFMYIQVALLALLTLFIYKKHEKI